MADTFTTVTGIVRVLMNDPEQAVWSDATLGPIVARAFADTESALALNGGELAVATKILTNLSGSIDKIDDASTPALPTDLLWPIVLFDRRTATTEDFLLVERALIPWEWELTQTGMRFLMWRWEGQAEAKTRALLLTRADNARDVMLVYERQMPDFASGDTIPLRGAVSAVAWRTCALCEYARGNTILFDRSNVEWQNAMMLLIGRETRDQQFAPLVREPHGSGWQS